MTSKVKMPEIDIPDQLIVNIEAYLIDSHCPQEILINFAKMALELRRRRFEALEKSKK